MVNTILIDAGPLIALFDRDDKYHKKVKAFLKGKPYHFVTSLAVLTEVSYMLNFSIHAQTDFLEWIMFHGVIIREIYQHDIPRIISLTTQYQDLPMDFADATLVVIAEQYNIRTIISLDSDFNIYRLPGKQMIKNIFTD